MIVPLHLKWIIILVSIMLSSRLHWWCLTPVCITKIDWRVYMAACSGARELHFFHHRNSSETFQQLVTRNRQEIVHLSIFVHENLTQLSTFIRSFLYSWSEATVLNFQVVEEKESLFLLLATSRLVHLLVKNTRVVPTPFNSKSQKLLFMYMYSCQAMVNAFQCHWLGNW